MQEARILPPAAKFPKKIKDKNLKRLYRKAIESIVADPTIGEEKIGDLRGVFGYDIYYNKTNYELAYTIRNYTDILKEVNVSKRMYLTRNGHGE